LGRLPDSPLPELLHGDGYSLQMPWVQGDFLSPWHSIKGRFIFTKDLEANVFEC
jgi:hypothetical protein